MFEILKLKVVDSLAVPNFTSMEMKLSKTKTRRQIAQEYGITPRTLRRWLKSHQIELPRRLIAPQDQLLIYENFGYPEVEIRLPASFRN